MEDHVLHGHLMGQDGPGLLGGDHDVGHGDDDPQVLRGLDGDDLEGLVRADYRESSQNAGGDVVRVESSGGDILGMRRAQDDLGERQLLAAQDVGDVGAAGRGCAGGTDTAAGPDALLNLQLDPEVRSAPAEDLGGRDTDGVLLGVRRDPLGSGAADLRYDDPGVDPPSLDDVERLLQS